MAKRSTLVVAILTLGFALGALPGAAQAAPTRGDVHLAGGASVGPKTSALRGEAHIAINRGVFFVFSARRLSSSFACDTNGAGTVPCEPDGYSAAGGLRVDMGASSVRPYAEATGGIHRYSNGDWRPIIGGQAGLSFSVGDRTRADVGYELIRLQARYVQPSAPGPFSSDTRHISHGVTIGLRWST